jgi:hypothetical protein
MIETFFLQCQVQAETNNWFLDKLLPSFIGAATALLVFFLTSKRDRNKEQSKKDDERGDKMSYLKNLLTNVVTLTEHQSKNLDEHIEKVKTNDIDFHLMTFIPLTDFIRAIETLSKEDCFIAFNQYYKDKFDTTKIFEKALSNIDFLHAEFMEVPEILKKAQQFDYERKLQYKDTVDKTISLVGNLLFSVRRNIRPPFDLLDKLFLEFMEGLKNHSDLNYYHHKFVLPINDLFVDYLSDSNNSVSQEILTIAENSRNANQLYNTIKLSNREVGLDMTQINDLVKYIICIRLSYTIYIA